MNYRMDRLNSEMLKCISDVINNKVKDPRVCGMVSVLSVDCAKDLKTAKVVVSIYGNRDTVKGTFDGLVKCSGFIRRELAMYFRDLRCVPELRFYLDDSMEYSAKIDSILDELKSR